MEAIELRPTETFAELMGSEKKAAELQRLPHYMLPGIVRYVARGIRPGSFLVAVICANQEDMRRKADLNNKAILDIYPSVFDVIMPFQAWGNPDQMEWWIDQGGMIGLGLGGFRIEPSQN